VRRQPTYAARGEPVLVPTNPLHCLADRRVKASPEQFREALRGRVTKHHRFVLRLHLNQIDALDAASATVDVKGTHNKVTMSMKAAMDQQF
jgi:hypothetical protein